MGSDPIGLPAGYFGEHCTARRVGRVRSRQLRRLRPADDVSRPRRGAPGIGTVVPFHDSGIDSGGAGLVSRTEHPMRVGPLPRSGGCWARLGVDALPRPPRMGPRPRDQRGGPAHLGPSPSVQLTPNAIARGIRNRRACMRGHGRRRAPDSGARCDAMADSGRGSDGNGYERHTPGSVPTCVAGGGGAQRCCARGSG